MFLKQGTKAGVGGGDEEFPSGFFGELVQGRSLQVGNSGHWTAQLLPRASHAVLVGSTKGLVETCLMLSKMAPTLRHCCSMVTLCQTPFFLMETRSMRNFPWGCHWHAGTPWPQAGQLGEPHSVVYTRKERADGPVL